jgi:hypothetical protein
MGIDVYYKEALIAMKRLDSTAIRHYFGTRATVLFAYRTSDLPRLLEITPRDGFALHLQKVWFWNFHHNGEPLDPMWSTLRTLDPGTIAAAISDKVVDLAARTAAPPIRLQRPGTCPTIH